MDGILNYTQLKNPMKIVMPFHIHTQEVPSRAHKSMLSYAMDE